LPSEPTETPAPSEQPATAPGPATAPPAAAPAAPALDPKLFLRLIVLGALIGVPAALAAALFQAAVHEGQDLLWTSLPQRMGRSSPPWYLVVFLPAVGGAIVWAARKFLPGDGGHRPLAGIGGGATPVSWGIGIILAALGTLIFGAVLGPEAPLIAIGSVVGMIVVSIGRLQGPSQVVLATAGSFSAISALFGGPLVAGFLLLEAGIGMGTSLLPALLPGLVAAAIGYELFIGFGNWAGLHETGLHVTGLPVYHSEAFDLLEAVVVGVVTAIVIILIRKFAYLVEDRAKRRLGLFLLAGGVAVGLLAEIARLLGANSQDVLFSGQSAIPDLVLITSTGTMLVLLVTKSIGYSVSLGSGFRGGPIFPSIFVGVAVASLCHIWFHTSETWAVAVGTAAGMSASSRLVFAPLMFSAILVGTAGVDAIPAAALALVAAWLTSMALRTRLGVDTPEQLGGVAPPTAAATAG
jgi:H+/Cl- antiporter ClcA